MKKWQLCIGFGYDREEAVAFQKQILSAFDGMITEAECPCFQIGATISVHTGPYPIGVGFIRKRRFVNKIRKSQPCFTTVWDFLCHMDT